MRNRRYRSIAWAAAAIVPALIAWRAVDTNLNVQPASRLWVSGTSTVRSFECGASTFDLAVDAEHADPVMALLAAQKAVTTVTLRVIAAKLDCKNDKMNEHMLKALKAKDFPDIAFTLDTYALERTGDGTHARLNGTLTLAGVNKQITMTALVSAGAEGAIRIAGSYPLKMTEFGLQPPKLMLGALKVNELVNVNFDVLLKP